jgi:uncharacterized protein (TIGR03083 family)
VDNDAPTIIAALRNSHERLALLTGAMSSEQLTGRSYCRDWTVAQVLSHLGSGAEIALRALDAALAGTTADSDANPAIWDAWNAKTPQQQAADCLPADDAHIKRFEGLSGAELDGISLDLYGMHLDAAGLARMRLSEHAVHTWDVAVALDPAAEVAPDAAVRARGAHLGRGRGPRPRGRGGAGRGGTAATAAADARRMDREAGRRAVPAAAARHRARG